MAPPGVPAWDWLIHEAWWRLTRRPQRQRRFGRADIRNHYTNRHLWNAVRSSGIPEAQQPAAWQQLVKALDKELP